MIQGLIYTKTVNSLFVPEWTKKNFLTNCHGSQLLSEWLNDLIINTGNIPQRIRIFKWSVWVNDSMTHLKKRLFCSWMNERFWMNQLSTLIQWLIHTKTVNWFVCSWMNLCVWTNHLFNYPFIQFYFNDSMILVTYYVAEWIHIFNKLLTELNQWLTHKYRLLSCVSR